MNLGNVTPLSATLQVPQPRADVGVPQPGRRRAPDPVELTEALAWFVRDRYVERAASADPLDARWANGMLQVLDAMRAYLVERPDSRREFLGLLQGLARTQWLERNDPGR